MTMARTKEETRVRDTPSEFHLENVCRREDLGCKEKILTDGLCKKHHYYFIKALREHIQEEKKNGKFKQSSVNR